MKKLRWGFLSTSRAGAAYAMAIHNSRNGELYAVASRSSEKAGRFAREYGFSCSYGSYDALLSDPNVDAIYLPLPFALRCEWGLKAAAAGKPVLCEKPLALSAWDAKRMRDAFAQKKLPLLEAYAYRYHPLNQKSYELCRAGRIGKILNMRSAFTTDMSNLKDMRLRRDLGGGALRDLGCHCLDLFRFIMVEEPISAKAVAIVHPEAGVDMQATGVLRFSSGAVASFNCGFESPYTCGYEIIGSDGRILCDIGAMVAWPVGQFHLKVWSHGRYEEIPVPPANPYQLIAEHFADAVLLKYPLISSPDDSVKGMELLDKLYASISE